LVNRGTMGVNSLPKTVTRQRRGCDLNPGLSAPESITLTTRILSHPVEREPCKKDRTERDAVLGADLRGPEMGVHVGVTWRMQ